MTTDNGSDRSARDASAAIRILIVDDDESIRRLLVASLGVLDGIEVVGTAVDGVGALEQVASLRPDCVVIDLMMPRMDGAQATEEIKRRFPSVVVFGFTSMDE